MRTRELAPATAPPALQAELGAIADRLEAARDIDAVRREAAALRRLASRS